MADQSPAPADNALINHSDKSRRQLKLALHQNDLHKAEITRLQDALDATRAELADARRTIEFLTEQNTQLATEQPARRTRTGKGE
jgi:hypothetical protein